MIYLDLFLTFFKVGIVSFGGGLGMISIIRDEVLSHGWLSYEMFLNFVAVSESTPGPIAVNMATFVGSSQAGFLGAICATLGVVSPSFIIILIISKFLSRFLEYKGVKKVLLFVRPTVIAIICAIGVEMVIQVLIGIKKIGDPIVFDYRKIIIFSFLLVVSVLGYIFRKKFMPPLMIMAISGLLGLIIYAF